MPRWKSLIVPDGEFSRESFLEACRDNGVKYLAFGNSDAEKFNYERIARVGVVEEIYSDALGRKLLRVKYDD